MKCSKCGGWMEFADYKHPSGARWYVCKECGHETTKA